MGYRRVSAAVPPRRWLARRRRVTVGSGQSAITAHPPILFSAPFASLGLCVSPPQAMAARRGDRHSGLLFGAGMTAPPAGVTVDPAGMTDGPSGRSRAPAGRTDGPSGMTKRARGRTGRGAIYFFPAQGARRRVRWVGCGANSRRRVSGRVTGKNSATDYTDQHR